MKLMTIRLDFALQTDTDVPAREYADALAEEIELMLPRVSIWRGQEHGFDWADITRVAVASASQQ